MAGNNILFNLIINLLTNDKFCDIIMISQRDNIFKGENQYGKSP